MEVAGAKERLEHVSGRSKEGAGVCKQPEHGGG
jgi:hypothetical protein